MSRNRLGTLSFSLLFFSLAGPGAAEITGVRVLGTTATQAVLAYVAPDNNACTVEVSESQSYAPLAPDVDPAKFSGAHLDGRPGNIAEGRFRAFVIGKRASGWDSTGARVYSRALQCDTRHYYRIRCGADTAVGSFQTLNIPLGGGLLDTIPSDPRNPGYPLWPTLAATQRPDLPGHVSNEQIVDPQTGILIKRLTLPGETQVDDLTELPPAASIYREVGTGSEWSNLAGISARDGSAAVYSGANGNWLAAFPNPYLNPVYEGGHIEIGGYSMDRLQIRIAAWCSSPNCSSAGAADRTLDLCLTTDGGASCESAVLSLAVGAGAPGEPATVPPVSTPILAEWTPPYRLPLSIADMGARNAVVDLAPGGVVQFAGGNLFNFKLAEGARLKIGPCGGTLGNYTLAALESSTRLRLVERPPAASAQCLEAPTFGVRIRKRTASAHQISVDYLAIQTQRTGSFGNRNASALYHDCSPVKTSDGGFHCLFDDRLLWVKADTGESRFLGQASIPAAGNWQSGSCVGPIWDATDPNVWYCTGVSVTGNTVILKGTFSGGRGARPGGEPELQANPSITYINLTSPDPLSIQVRNWVAANLPGEQFNPAFYSCSMTKGVQPGYLPFHCLRAGQDTMGWAGQFRVTGNPGVVAVSSSWKKPGSRWGVIHNATNYPQTGWSSYGLNPMVHDSPTPGSGPYQTRLNMGAGMPACVLGVNCSACPSNLVEPALGGRRNCTVLTVRGEPCDRTPALDATEEQDDRQGKCNLDPEDPLTYYLQDAAPGDAAKVDSEYIRILAKSGTSWTVARNFDALSTEAPSHANGALVTMLPVTTPEWLQVGFEGPEVYWNFPSQPTGNQFAQDRQPETGHAAYGLGRWIDANYRIVGQGTRDFYKVRIGQFPSWMTAPTSARIAMKQTFGGVSDPFGFESHHTALQTLATPAESQWSVDAIPMTNRTGETITRVSGNLYRITGAGLNRALFPTHVSSGFLQAIDISGPGAVLTGGSSDAYKFCVPLRPNECLPGSAVGEVYVNMPFLGGAPDGCGGAFENPDYLDLCVGDSGPYTSTLMQFGITEDHLNGERSRVLSRGLAWYRLGAPYWNIKPLGDASWFYTRTTYLGNTRSDVLLLKNPGFPASSSVPRDDFVQVPLHLTPPAGMGVDNVIVEFGYNPDLHCTSRREVCVQGGWQANAGLRPRRPSRMDQPAAEANGSSAYDADDQADGDIPEQDSAWNDTDPRPYGFAGDARPGVPCARSCTVPVPAYSQRVLYYRWKYRDARNQILAASQMQVLAVP